MPSREADPVKARMRFGALQQEGLFTHTELRERFGVSRQAGYDLMKRYHADGVDGLKDRSHAPKQVPHRIPEEIAFVLLETRMAHPDWGPRTILGASAPNTPKPRCRVLGAECRVRGTRVRRHAVGPARGTASRGSARSPSNLPHLPTTSKRLRPGSARVRVGKIAGPRVSATPRSVSA